MGSNTSQRLLIGRIIKKGVLFKNNEYLQDQVIVHFSQLPFTFQKQHQNSLPLATKCNILL